MEEKPLYKPSLQTFAGPQEYSQPNSSLVISPLLAILTPWSWQLIAYARQINRDGQHSFSDTAGEQVLDFVNQPHSG
jgi:hypothetical protein